MNPIERQIEDHKKLAGWFLAIVLSALLWLLIFTVIFLFVRLGAQVMLGWLFGAALFTATVLNVHEYTSRLIKPKKKVQHFPSDRAAPPQWDENHPLPRFKDYIKPHREEL